MESLRNSASLKKFEFETTKKTEKKSLLIQQGTEKTEKKSCFALDQLYIELKTNSLFIKTSNVLPFKFKC
jgi:hypothetical protein